MEWIRTQKPHTQSKMLSVNQWFIFKIKLLIHAYSLSYKIPRLTAADVGMKFWNKVPFQSSFENLNWWVRMSSTHSIHCLFMTLSFSVINYNLISFLIVILLFTFNFWLGSNELLMGSVHQYTFSWSKL